MSLRMSSAIVSHISWAPYVKWTETVTDNCRHARLYATTRIPHQPSALGGHISSILYIKWTMTVISDMYDKVNNTRNHCILNVCYSIHPYIGEIISLNIKSNHTHFHSRKYIRKCRLQNDHHVVWARSVFVYVQFIAAQQECLFNTMLKLIQKRQSSVLLSLCEENPSVTSEFPSQMSTNAERRLPTMMRHSC